MSEIDDRITLSYDSHDRLSQFERLVYPVVSRRSGGLSLGINLNPDKRCNFDCVYCQVERDDGAPEFEPTMIQVERELRDWLDKVAEQGYRGYPLRDIGLAGDGEPTTVRILPQVLRLLIDLKQEYGLADEVKLVLFTNATKIDRKDLRSLWPDFYQARGEVWCKLDFWDADSLEQLNRTRAPFERLVDKIIDFGNQYPLVMQSCFFNWCNQSFNIDHYDRYIELVELLLERGTQINKIQAYTLARQPAEAQAHPWSDEQMDALAVALRRRLPLEVELFYETGIEQDGVENQA